MAAAKPIVLTDIANQAGLLPAISKTQSPKM